MPQTYYEILQVKPLATYEEIKRAFRQRAMECHPDRFQDDQARRAGKERFIVLREAYSVLIDLNKRRLYDEQLLKHSQVSTQNVRREDLRSGRSKATASSHRTQQKPASKYSGYERADSKKDQKEIDELYQEIFAESASAFTGYTLASIVLLVFSAIGTFYALVNGAGLLTVVPLLWTVALAYGLYVRARRLANWSGGELYDKYHNAEIPEGPRNRHETKEERYKRISLEMDLSAEIRSQLKYDIHNQQLYLIRAILWEGKYKSIERVRRNGQDIWEIHLFTGETIKYSKQSSGKRYE